MCETLKVDMLFASPDIYSMGCTYAEHYEEAATWYFYCVLSVGDIEVDLILKDSVIDIVFDLSVDEINGDELKKVHAVIDDNISFWMEELRSCIKK